MAKVILVEFPAILVRFYHQCCCITSPQKGMEGGGGGVGWENDTTKWTRMVIEGTRPQNSPSEAGNRLKSHKTDIRHTFSSLLVCPECMNPI